MDINGAKGYILKRLKAELNPTLFYHNIEHTMDVYHSTCKLASLENINGESKIILETAALFHDAGMMVQYLNHEDFSVGFAREALPAFDYSSEAIEYIALLIQVTRLPQNPVDLCQQILCDADLDYLGREDYLINALKLRVEWQVNNIKQTDLKEWFDIQVEFLGNHTYFTRSAISLRKEKKEKNLEEIRYLLHNC